MKNLNYTFRYYKDNMKCMQSKCTLIFVLIFGFCITTTIGYGDLELMNINIIENTLSQTTVENRNENIPYRPIRKRNVAVDPTMVTDSSTSKFNLTESSTRLTLILQ